MDKIFLIDDLVMFVKSRRKEWFVVYKCVNTYYITTLDNYRGDKPNPNDVIIANHFDSFDEIATVIQVCF